MAEELNLGEWTPDEWNCLNLCFEHEGRRFHVFIQARPSYCDRGHYSLDIDGPMDLDAADRFPRYFMSLDRAKAEAEDFLRWRLAHIRTEPMKEMKHAT